MSNSFKDAAILRLEQLAPFPYDRVKELIQQYKNASEVIWVQEEHFNGGAWGFVSERFDVVTKFNVLAAFF